MSTLRRALNRFGIDRYQDEERPDPSVQVHPIDRGSDDDEKSLGEMTRRERFLFNNGGRKAVLEERGYVHREEHGDRPDCKRCVNWRLNGKTRDEEHRDTCNDRRCQDTAHGDQHERPTVQARIRPETELPRPTDRQSGSSGPSAAEMPALRQGDRQGMATADPAKAAQRRGQADDKQAAETAPVRADGQVKNKGGRPKGRRDSRPRVRTVRRRAK